MKNENLLFQTISEMFNITLENAIHYLNDNPNCEIVKIWMASNEKGLFDTKEPNFDNKVELKSF